MARKYYEQMLINELEIRKATNFPKWYAAQNQMNFGLWNPNMNQGLSNLARVNRQDLYSLEHFRQPFWMPPQTVLFPNYQPICFVRRSNRYFFNGKRHFTRDKRSNSEDKHSRQEDVNNFRGECGKTVDFQSNFGRQHRNDWNRENQHYQRPLDDKTVSNLSVRNRSFDLYPENLMMERHVGQKSNSSMECLPVRENFQQTRPGSDENVIQAESQNINYEISSLDWTNQADNHSKNAGASQYPASQTYTNESWYCPEEQQQIVDMLKEVNLRHDRQLQRDILLSQSDHSGSDDVTSNVNDSQTSLSSDDDDDNVTILLYPGGIPPIPEEEGSDEVLKTEPYDKSTNNLFEEFQNIFTDSPGKKILNEMIKDVSEKSQNIKHDDQGITRNVISDEDKDAVKIVLDFEHVDDLTENTFHNCRKIVPPRASDEIENKSSVTNFEKQNSTIQEERHLDAKTKDIEMISDSDSMLKLNNYSNSYDGSEVVENADDSLLAPAKQSTITLGSKKYSKTKKSNDSELSSVNNLYHAENNANREPLITPVQKNRNCCDKFVRKDTPFPQFSQKRISKDTYYGDTQKSKFQEERSENQHFLPKNASSSTMNNIKDSILNSSNETIPYENLNGERNSGENRKLRTDVKNYLENSDKSSGLQNGIFPKPFQTRKYGSSVSEIYLLPKANHAVYKRISISEIFSDNSAVCKHECLKSSGQQHIAHLIDINKSTKDLTPSEHLKLILGIGQTHDIIKSDKENSLNFLRKESLNEFQSFDNLETNSNVENLKNISKSLQRQDLKSPNLSKSPTEVSTKLTDIHKIKLSKDPEEGSNLDKPALLETVDKYSSSNANLHVSENQISQSHISENNQVSALKSKKKQRNRKEKQRKECFPDKETPSRANFIEHETNQNNNCQPSATRISEKKSKCKQKLTPDVGVQTHKLFLESESNNEYLLNRNSRKISKNKELNASCSKNSDQKNSLRCSEVFTDVNGSNLPINIGKAGEEILDTLNSNFVSSNSKYMNSSNTFQRNSTSKEKSFSDPRFSSPSSKKDTNCEKHIAGINSTHTYSDIQIINSKYIHQKRYNKCRETFPHLNSIPINKKDNMFTSANSTSDSAKTFTANSKYYYKKHYIKDNVSNACIPDSQLSISNEKSNCKLSAGNCHTNLGLSMARKKSEEKQKEKITSESENLSEQCNQTKQTDNINNSSKESLKERYKDPMNEIAVKNASSNCKKNAKSFLPSSETKTKENYFRKSYIDDTSTVSFNNTKSVYGLEKYSARFNKYAANMNEENSYVGQKNSRFQNCKLRKVSRINENVSQQEQEFAKNNTHHKNNNAIENLFFSSVKEIRKSCDFPLNEDSNHKNKHLENAIITDGKNSILEKNISHCMEGKMQKCSKKYTRPINHTIMKNSSSESHPNNLCYDKLSGPFEGELSKNENCDSKKISYTIEKVTQAYDGLQQNREQKVNGWPSQKYINGKTKKAHNYKNTCTKEKGLIFKDVALKNAPNTDTESQTKKLLDTTFQDNAFGFTHISKAFSNQKPSMSTPSEEHTYASSTPATAVYAVSLLTGIPKSIHSLVNGNPVDSTFLDSGFNGINEEEKTLDKAEHFSRNQKPKFSTEKSSKSKYAKLNKNVDVTLFLNVPYETALKLAIEEVNEKNFISAQTAKSLSRKVETLNSKNPCILKEIEKFGDFLKYFVKNYKRKIVSRNLEILCTPELKGVKEQKHPKKHRNINFMRPMFLAVTPEVMRTYMRSKESSKMNPFLDVHVHFYVEDFFADIQFVTSNEKFQNGIKILLKSTRRKTFILCP